MANIVFNIAKGRVAELYNRVKSNDPTNSAIILVPIETSGLESDATLIDVDTLAALSIVHDRTPPSLSASPVPMVTSPTAPSVACGRPSSVFVTAVIA